ncbi:MAG: hypothetical protein UW92_C0034G0008 [Candidatus Jorgensenbacteria bacterium GW2011_GWA2_45_13]|uniref:Uncharacterized protein n=1 Tax=Candidatus Jorgensenbacteria bacterium GW2011_GWA2_45_13 TaxID=1618662 RepID=A0A0G1L3N9_9BACT|nr:MAG: hypothetical protein UW92_C0034G0008 [Candidatus Jorgensenbacteria bacterium GW2011_GWA2_45_13]
MRKIIPLAVTVLLCVFFYTQFSSAQTTGADSATITWHSNSFYPSDFGGKPLPINQSVVSASVTLFQNQKIQDTSNLLVFWYLDGEFLQKGIGLSTVTFPIGKVAGSVITLHSIPYFFNISSLSDLSFSWMVGGFIQNNEASSDITLNIGDVGASGEVRVKSIIQNTKRATENKQTEIILHNQ